MGGLTVYRASAGSGKTFAITREYIRLLFENHENYRHILGVTFTNKATAEMKSRIIIELDNLSKGKPSGYAPELIKKFKYSEEELKRKASVILYAILHDYSHFNILTIDKFFQRIIRSFAREIGYYQGFDLELDQNKILTASVDEMIDSLDINFELKNWLVRFAEQRINEGGSWNIVKEIEHLGQEIFKENFKAFSEDFINKLSNKSFLEDFGRSLTEVNKEIGSHLNRLGSEAIQIIDKYGLVQDDFKGKSRSVAAFFKKVSQLKAFNEWEVSKTIEDHLDIVDNWRTKDSPDNIISAYENGLNRLLQEILNIRSEKMPLYYSVLAVQKHLNVLGILSDLIRHIQAYTSGKNLFLISDTSQFLNQLISGSDAPFVYERTGTFIHHFMIDEFQDTSSMQWNNFKPLILNSLSEDYRNWIVGDVKQSIYRWRNSDWTILSEQLPNDINPFQVHTEELEYNWRSSRNIIRFNNAFFNKVKDLLLSEVVDSEDNVSGEDLLYYENLVSSAYGRFAQLIPETRKEDIGCVSIEFLGGAAAEENSFATLALEKLPFMIDDILEKGFQLKDIAILVRTRKEGSLVSDYLLKYNGRSENNYAIISNDSLLLKNSEAVRWLVSAFQCIAEPSDTLSMAFLLYQYQEYLAEGISDNEKLHTLFSLSESSPVKKKFEEFFKMEGLDQYSVYELSDILISTFELTRLKNELAFILAFQDMLHEYVNSESSDLITFFNWWKNNQDNKVITMPEGQDAIRLMTLHSSKGLEFKIVLIPFADWTMMKSGYLNNIIWCTDSSEPFNKMEVVPVSLTSKLRKSTFSRYYYKEKALSYVDNLNLLYVAFTRAIEGLFIFAPFPRKDMTNNNIGNLIFQTIQKENSDSIIADYPTINLTDYWLNEKHLFLYGSMPDNSKYESTGQQITLDEINYPIRMVSGIVREDSLSGEYLSSNNEVLMSHASKGKILHEIFQRIIYVSDVEKSLLSLQMEGKIQEADIPVLKDTISNLLIDKRVNDWFLPGWKVLTEPEILLPNGAIRRPDRVMLKDNAAVVIDYKFGEIESPEHIIQVNQYLKYLKQMNYYIVSGYIWYASLGKVVSLKEGIPVQGKLF